MLIAEFAEVTGLTRDAVRFYVKNALLRPRVATHGNRYQHFDDSDIERVVLIQTARSLGFTIRQIVGFNQELESGKMDRKRQIAVMSERLAALEQQAQKLSAMRAYLKKKIAWMQAGEVGPAPQLKGRPASKLPFAGAQADCLHDSATSLKAAEKKLAGGSRIKVQPRSRAALQP